MTEQKKACPMTFNHEPDFCIKQRCAWWDIDFKECAILRLNIILKAIQLGEK